MKKSDLLKLLGRTEAMGDEISLLARKLQDEIEKQKIKK
jgi:hypothetical protein